MITRECLPAVEVVTRRVFPAGTLCRFCGYKTTHKTKFKNKVGYTRGVCNMCGHRVNRDKYDVVNMPHTFTPAGSEVSKTVMVPTAFVSPTKAYTVSVTLLRNELKRKRTRTGKFKKIEVPEPVHSFKLLSTSNSPRVVNAVVNDALKKRKFGEGVDPHLEWDDFTARLIK